MDRTRRERITSFVLLPALLVAVGIVAYFTIRTTFQLDTLRQQSVLEATFGLANEKANRLDRQIIDQDNVVLAVADPAQLGLLTERWLPTATRETPSVRGILILDEQFSVLSFASRATSAFSEEETFRRLLVQRLLPEMPLGNMPVDELRHLHREYGAQSYLISYWLRQWQGRRYLVVAWHDIGRIVKETLPMLYSERANFGDVAKGQSRVNVVDEDGRIIFGPPLRSGEFTVGVKFPTTLYNWRLQVSPAASEEFASRVERRRRLEIVLLGLSSLVIVAGVVVIVVAAERERRVSAIKSEFVANVSHELKTPLALVRMFAEMLHTGRVSSEDKRREYTDIIMRESERLSSLIENVLDFAKVERGRKAYDFANGDLGAAVREAVLVLQYRVEREGTPMVVTVEEGLPEISLDVHAVGLAVINLVDNALKYGQGEEVRVRVAGLGKSLVVSVEDDGPGIAAEDRSRIFERFVRGTGNVDAQGLPVRGSGIGLSLVKHVAESHGGKAWVDSPLSSGRGSRFCFSLPRRRQKAANFRKSDE